MSYDAYLAINVTPFIRRFGMDDGLPRESVTTVFQVYATEISPDNQYLALGVSNAPYLEIYDMASGAKIDNVPSLSHYINTNMCLAFSPDVRRMYCGVYASPYLNIINLETWGIVSSGITLATRPAGLSVSPDGKLLIVYFSSSYSPVVIDTDSMTVVNTNNVFPMYMYGGAFNEDGSIFYVGTTTAPSVRAIRTADWTQIASITGLNYPVLVFASGYLFYKNNNAVGFGVFDQSFNAVPGASALITRQVMTMKASPDGRYLLLVFSDNAYPRVVRMSIGDWRVEPVDALSLATFGVNDIAISRPEFKRIYGTVRDKEGHPAQRTVRIFRRGNGRMVAEQQSDAATGDYEALVVDGEYDVVAMAADGENLNDLIHARVTSE